MRILIIRHADPNYEIDGLTEVGKVEADLLARRLANERIDYIYSSPLGRARRTAEPTEAALGITPTIVDWLREFSYKRCELPYKEDAIAWDLLPEFVNENNGLYDKDGWREVDFIKNSEIPTAYDEVCRAFDAMMARHGYERFGTSYLARRANHDTIALFCHYGVTAVLLSHILNVSPYAAWQNMVTLPSSVTTIYTEERREGVASLRMQMLGDLSHLYKYGKEPSFSARFCECYTDDSRHD